MARNKTSILGFVCIVGMASFQLSRVVFSKLSLLQGFLPSLLSARGTVAFQPQEVNESTLLFDLVSIGSKTRPDYQDAQHETFGSHRTIRHFLRITEDDDSDQGCRHQNLTKEEAYQISKYCRSRLRARYKIVLRYLRNYYAKVSWLEKKSNPAGWICAQARAVHGFGKAIRLYREQREPLPDFLVIMDDDTYINMELVSEFLNNNTSRDLPHAIAGCLVRSPIHQINFTFPFGGWGMIYNKQALENLMRPIIGCSEGLNSSDDFLRGACYAINDNQISEREVFREGMSLSDLMQAYVAWQPFTHFRNWTTGYCLHGDWMWGYFTNFYPVSIHDPSPYYKDVPHARLVGYNGSEIYGEKNLFKRKQCDNLYDRCTKESHLCHYQDPKMMKRHSREDTDESNLNATN